MATPTTGTLILSSASSKPSPFLRIPPEVVLEIFKHCSREDQKSLSSTSLLLREIGKPVIFETLEFFDQKDNTIVDFRALSSSPLRTLVRTLHSSFSRRGVHHHPLNPELLALGLVRFPKLTTISSDITADSFLDIYRTPRIEHLYFRGPEFYKIWSAVVKTGPLPRRDSPLFLSHPHRPSLYFGFTPHTFDDGLNNAWRYSLPPSVTDKDWFLSTTSSANLRFPRLTVEVDASVPIPSSAFLVTTKLLSLQDLKVFVCKQPTPEFMESLGVVAVVQSPSRSFTLQLQTTHPLLPSFGQLGRFQPFEEMAGVSGWEGLGPVSSAAVKFDTRNWTVEELQLQLKDATVTSSFLNSAGAFFRNLTSLELQSFSLEEAIWPADWNTAVEAFRSFPSLTLPPSLTPVPTLNNLPACSETAFDYLLSKSHPLLHQQTLSAGGWWVAWKRLGFMLNLSRVRRLGTSLPNGCVVVWGSSPLGWCGKVVVLEGSGGKTAMPGSGSFEEGSEEEREIMVGTRADCDPHSAGTRVRGWRCFSCRREGRGMDLFEAARLCGEEEFEKALKDRTSSSNTNSLNDPSTRRIQPPFDVSLTQANRHLTYSQPFHSQATTTQKRHLQNRAFSPSLIRTWTRRRRMNQ